MRDSAFDAWAPDGPRRRKGSKDTFLVETRTAPCSPPYIRAVVPSQSISDEGSGRNGTQASAAFDDRATDGVTNVECPAEVTVEAGTSFPCSLQIDGSAESVTVLVTGDNQTAQNGGPASGVYEVAAPA